MRLLRFARNDRPIIVLIILINIALFVALSPLHAAEKAPKIQIVTADADLGEVVKGKMLDYLIEVRNMGKEDLAIQNVYSGCGCLEVTDKIWSGAIPVPVAVKPNHSINITARFDTNKENGQFEKMIHVISNDLENKDVMWKVKGVALEILKGDVIARSEATKQSNEIASSTASQSSRNDRKFVIMLFYSPGCSECREIMETFLPKIKEKYNNKILMVDYNIDNVESYAFFLELQNKYDERAKSGFFNPKPPVMFVANKLLYGVKEIKEGLEAVMLWD
jgi:hypothetical protein